MSCKSLKKINYELEIKKLTNGNENTFSFVFEDRSQIAIDLLAASKYFDFESTLIAVSAILEAFHLLNNY